jgi:predicted GNAT family acetyltransferase
MVLERADFVPAGPSSPARLRRVAPDDAEGHLTLVSEGLQLRREAVDRLFSPANMSLPCWRAYVTEVAGDVAATGVAVTAAGHVCLMGIVTAPAHRNRGHAAALTTRAVQDGLAAGAERAFLHASEMGAGLYRKLGFREVERWGIWTTGD